MYRSALFVPLQATLLILSHSQESCPMRRQRWSPNHGKLIATTQISLDGSTAPSQKRRRLERYVLSSRCPAGLEAVNFGSIRLQEGASIENALRRFKRKVQTEDIIKDVKPTFLLPETGSET
jgi:hypothetical protein